MDSTGLHQSLSPYAPEHSEGSSGNTIPIRVPGHVSMRDYRKSQEAPDSLSIAVGQKPVRKKYAKPRLKEDRNYDESVPLHFQCPSPPPSPPSPRYSEHGLPELNANPTAAMPVFTLDAKPTYTEILSFYHQAEHRSSPQSAIDSAVSLLLSDYSPLLQPTIPSEESPRPSISGAPAHAFDLNALRSTASTSTLGSRKRLPRPPTVRLHRSPRASVSNASLRSDYRSTSALPRASPSVASSKFQETRALAESGLSRRGIWHGTDWQIENWQFSNTAVNEPVTPPRTPVEFNGEDEPVEGADESDPLRVATLRALAESEGRKHTEPESYYRLGATRSWRDMEFKDDSSVASDTMSNKARRFADLHTAHHAITSRNLFDDPTTPTHEGAQDRQLDTQVYLHTPSEVIVRTNTLPPHPLRHKIGRQQLGPAERLTQSPDSNRSNFAALSSGTPPFPVSPNTATRVVTPTQPRVASPIQALRSLGNRLSAAFDKVPREGDESSVAESGDYEFNIAVSPRPPQLPLPQFGASSPDYFEHSRSPAGHFFDPSEENDASSTESEHNLHAYHEPNDPDHRKHLGNVQMTQEAFLQSFTNETNEDDDLYAEPRQRPGSFPTHERQSVRLTHHSMDDWYDEEDEEDPSRLPVTYTLNAMSYTANTLPMPYPMDPSAEWIEESESGLSNDQDTQESSGNNDSPFHLEVDLQSLESPIGPPPQMRLPGFQDNVSMVTIPLDNDKPHSPFADGVEGGSLSVDDSTVDEANADAEENSDASMNEGKLQPPDNTRSAVASGAVRIQGHRSDIDSEHEPAYVSAIPGPIAVTSSERHNPNDLSGFNFALDPNDAVVVSTADMADYYSMDLSHHPAARRSTVEPRGVAITTLPISEKNTSESSKGTKSQDGALASSQHPPVPPIPFRRRPSLSTTVHTNTSKDESTIGNLVRDYEQFNPSSSNFSHDHHLSLARSSVYSRTTEGMRYSTMANMNDQQEVMKELAGLLNAPSLAATPKIDTTPRIQPEQAAASQRVHRTPGEAPSAPLPPLPPPAVKTRQRSETTSTQTPSYGDTRQLLCDTSFTSPQQARGEQGIELSELHSVSPVTPTARGWGVGRYQPDRSRPFETPQNGHTPFSPDEGGTFTGRQPRSLHLVRSDYTLATAADQSPAGHSLVRSHRTGTPLRPIEYTPSLMPRVAHPYETRVGATVSYALFALCFCFPPFLLLLRLGACDWVVASYSKGRVLEVDRHVKRAAGWVALMGFAVWCIVLPVVLVVYFLTR